MYFMLEENSQSHGDGWLLVPVGEVADPGDTNHPLATTVKKVLIDNLKAAEILSLLILVLNYSLDSFFRLSVTQ
jgi:hypothetical protein